MDEFDSDLSSRAIPGLLEEMTAEEVRAFRPEVVVLPLGSTEPHGPHLPMGTDTFQVNHLCKLALESANARGARVLLYPALPITNNANFRSLPFALRIGVRTLMSIIMDIVVQCRDDGIDKVVIVNGHGGNPPAIEAALREIAGRDEMPFVCWTDGYGIAPDDFEDPVEHPSDHGGESETSCMMWIRPDLVRDDRLGKFPFGQLRAESLARAHFVRPWHRYVPEGAGGETGSSSAAKGQTLLEAHARALADLLVELSEAEYDENFPYIPPDRASKDTTMPDS